MSVAFASEPRVVEVLHSAWKSLMVRLHSRHFPAKLLFQAVMQFDQVLRQLHASALIGAGLAAHAVTNGSVATRTVLAALRSVRGVQIRLVSLTKGGGEKSPVQSLIAFNRFGEAFLLDSPCGGEIWQAAIFDANGQVAKQWSGSWLGLKSQLQLMDMGWHITLSTTAASGNPLWSHDYVTAPFWQLRREAWLVVGAALLVTALGVVTPLGFQAFTDKVLPFQATSSLTVVVVMLTLVIFSSCVTEFVHGYLQSVMAARFQQQLGTAVVKRLLHMPITFFDARPAGDVTKLATQVQEVSNFLVTQMLASLVAALSLIVVLPLLLLYSVPLTLLVLGMGVLMALTTALSVVQYQKKVGQAYKLDADFQSGLIELIKGVRTVKSLALERHFEHRMVTRLGNQLFGIFDLQRLGHGMRGVVNFQGRIVAVLILAVGAEAAFKGTLSVGQLIAFYMLSDRLIQPLVSLVQSVNGWQSFRLAKAKLCELQPSASVAIPLDITNALDGDIEFDKVWFRYPGTTIDVLKNVSFRVPKGSMVGLVGESGSGKSTVLGLLQGFYQPTGGCIRIGGVDLRDIPTEVLRSHMAMVSQTSFLFNLSVYENVRLGRLDASHEEILNALRASSSIDFVEAMPQRFGAVLSEDGANLSGGQRQRLAIARALLRSAPIMLFDEATSALDRDTEEQVKRAIKAACAGCTSLLIAHRWSTLADCSSILVMKDGSVVDQGRPQEVLAKLDRWSSAPTVPFVEPQAVLRRATDIGAVAHAI